MVVMLRNQMVRVARFSCGFFTVTAGKKEPGRSYVVLYPELMEKVSFQGQKQDLNFALLMTTARAIVRSMTKCPRARGKS